MTSTLKALGAAGAAGEPGGAGEVGSRGAGGSYGGLGEARRGLLLPGVGGRSTWVGVVARRGEEPGYIHLVDGGGEGGPQHRPHPVDPVEGEVAQHSRRTQAGVEDSLETPTYLLVLDARH